MPRKPKKNPYAAASDADLAKRIEQPDNPMFGSHISDSTERAIKRELRRRGFTNDEIGRMTCTGRVPKRKPGLKTKKNSKR